MVSNKIQLIAALIGVTLLWGNSVMAGYLEQCGYLESKFTSSGGDSKEACSYIKDIDTMLTVYKPEGDDVAASSGGSPEGVILPDSPQQSMGGSGNGNNVPWGAFQKQDKKH
jgi:hypothetical protein